MAGKYMTCHKITIDIWTPFVGLYNFYIHVRYINQWGSYMDGNFMTIHDISITNPTVELVNASCKPTESYCFGGDVLNLRVSTWTSVIDGNVGERPCEGRRWSKVLACIVLSPLVDFIASFGLANWFGNKNQSICRLLPLTSYLVWLVVSVIHIQEIILDASCTSCLNNNWWNLLFLLLFSQCQIRKKKPEVFLLGALTLVAGTDEQLESAWAPHPKVCVRNLSC